MLMLTKQPLGNKVILGAFAGGFVPCQNSSPVSENYPPYHIASQARKDADRSRHEQLKNFISTADPNIIYYASGFEIYALDVSTRRRRLIKSLPWQPLCLDAAHGWICVGGEESGQCAFISIDTNAIDGAAGQQSYAEVDDLLPLDLDPEYRHVRQDYHRTPPWPRYPLSPKYDVQHHELGSERVNSIKIHPLRSSHKNRGNEIVAVIT